jgi:hypothetical protein
MHLDIAITVKLDETQMLAIEKLLQDLAADKRLLTKTLKEAEKVSKEE